jgi:hypothetical protein
LIVDCNEYYLLSGDVQRPTNSKNAQSKKNLK